MMTIEVTTVSENEDGSADVEFTVSNEEEAQMLIEEGLNFLLLKSAFGLTTDQIVDILDKQSKLEAE
jgi:CRISPR/Cas system CSM-associated protein Csm2 small subunit